MKNVSDATFEAEVEKSPVPVLVDFWAPWCGPCRAVTPVLEEVSQEYDGRVQVVKLNTDENPETATRFRIRSIPTLMLVHHGKVVETIVGARPKTVYTKILDQALEAKN